MVVKLIKSPRHWLLQSPGVEACELPASYVDAVRSLLKTALVSGCLYNYHTVCFLTCYIYIHDGDKDLSLVAYALQLPGMRVCIYRSHRLDSLLCVVYDVLYTDESTLMQELTPVILIDASTRRPRTRQAHSRYTAAKRVH